MDQAPGALAPESLAQTGSGVGKEEMGSISRLSQKNFRVRGIPQTYKRDETEKLIREALQINLEETGLKVHSLASNPYRPSQEKVATVTFTKIPACLTCKISMDEWKFPLTTVDSALFSGQNDEDVPSKGMELVFDTRFRGLTPLRSFQNALDHKIDCVAITGMAGHAFGSFKERAGNHMWLRDSLLYDLSDARILIYGYDAKLAGSQSFQNLRDLAGHFRNHLRKLSEGQTPKPLLFIAHSLGGLIVKQALIQMSDGDNVDKANLRATCGALFFGVPSQGMDISSLVPLVGDQSNRYFLESLGKESDVLKEQGARFPKVFPFKDSEIYCFYETLKSPTAKQEGGKWTITGNPAVIVDSASATHSRPLEFQARFALAIHRSHSDLIKFANQDECYELVLEYLKKLASKAVDVVRSRFEICSPSDLKPIELTPDQQRCLQSLAFKKMQIRENDIESPAQKTCSWLLKHEKFLEWLYQPCGLLWIGGKPGAGKSTLMKYALQENMLLGSPKGPVVVSHFFHNRGVEIQRVPLGLYRSLLHQLSDNIHSVLSRITQIFKSKCERRGEPDKDWNWHPSELEDLLAAALLEAGKNYSIHILVDALDECGEEEAIGLVKYFRRLVSESRTAGGSLKVCFSCRHYPVMVLGDGAEIVVEDENCNDIKAYIQDELHLVMQDQEKSKLGNQITERASGIFLWVVLVVPRVCGLLRSGKSLSFIESYVKKLPPELHSLYQELLREVPEEDIPHSLQLFQWISFACRPLTLAELRHAIIIDTDTFYKSLSEYQHLSEYVASAEEMECRIKDLCRGLAEIKQYKNSRVVQFIHESVNDFLIQEGLRILDASFESIDLAIGHSHRQISIACIKYITLTEVGDWASQRKSGTLDSTGELLGLPFLEYAASFWVPHAQIVEARGISQDNLLSLFRYSTPKILGRWSDARVFILGYNELKKSSLLHVASTSGLLSVVKTMLQPGIDVDILDATYSTPLICAARGGHEPIVKLLLEMGADPECYNMSGNALFWTAFHGHEAILKLLLEYGVNVNSKHAPLTPISTFSFDGINEVAETLLEAGLDVDSFDWNGIKPTSHATEAGDQSMTKLSLREGTKMCPKDANGRKIWWSVVESRCSAMEPQLANMESCDHRGMTPLPYTARTVNKAAIKLLLEKGVNVFSGNDSDTSPLSWAVFKGHETNVRLLLENGADMETSDENGNTPLSWATKTGHTEIEKLLLDHRAKRSMSKEKEGASSNEKEGKWSKVAKSMNEHPQAQRHYTAEECEARYRFLLFNG